jgi:translation initiation factor IF-2
MSKVTVSQLADVLGVDGEKLLSQLKDAGIEAKSGDDEVSNEDKKKLLAHLRASHGKVESDATAPRKVTLKRKSLSELRVAGSGPRASTRTVNVEVRKRRTYVKREVVEKEIGTDDADREQARQLLAESRAKREAEEKAVQEAADQARQKKEEEARIAAAPRTRSANVKMSASGNWLKNNGVVKAKRKKPSRKPAMAARNCTLPAALPPGAASPGCVAGPRPAALPSMASQNQPHR